MSADTTYFGDCEGIVTYRVPLTKSLAKAVSSKSPGYSEGCIAESQFLVRIEKGL